MTKIKFIEKDENAYDVEINGEDYGSLEFDSAQNAWVLWFCGCYGDEGVTYFEDLKETKECIADEIYFAEKEKTKEKTKAINYNTYIKNIEALPNFGGWVLYDLEGIILEEFEAYDEMVEVYDYSYKSSDIVPGYQVNNELKAAKIYR